MSSRKYRVKMTSPFTDGVIASLRLGAVVGMCISGFLLYRQMTGNLESLGGCEGAWNCEEVFKSKWGSVLGIPVVALAFLVYAGMFVLSLNAVRKRGRVSVVLLGGLGVALLATSMWFVGLQVTHGIKCTFCMLAQLVGLGVGGIVTLSLIHAIRFRVRVAALPTFAFAAVAALAVVAGQLAGTGNDLSDGGKGDDPGASRDGQRFEDGSYKFPNLGISIERGRFPTIGNPQAEKAMVVLIDYSTISSQLIQPYLAAVVEQLGDELAMILVPVPLDRDCNEFWGAAESRNACQIAAYANAAWAANPRIYGNYHDFLMEGGARSESGSIAGLVWHDENSNGLRDPGEAGIENVKMDLLNSLDVTSVPRRTTDASGEYVFANQPVGLADLRYQVQVSDANFSDGGALAGMILTAGSGGARNRSDYLELSNIAATVTGNDFGFVATEHYDEASLKGSRDDTPSASPEAEAEDPYLAELLRLAGESADEVLRLLPDFGENRKTGGGADAGAGDQPAATDDWRNAANAVVENLLSGCQIYGDLLPLSSPVLPKIIFGADQIRSGMIDERPPAFVKSVADASDLTPRTR